MFHSAHFPLTFRWFYRERHMLLLVNGIISSGHLIPRNSLFCIIHIIRFGDLCLPIIKLNHDCNYNKKQILIALRTLLESLGMFCMTSWSL